MPHSSLVKSKSMFSFAAPKIRNSLLLSLRETTSVSLFKALSKSYFFNIAFKDIANVEQLCYVFCRSSHLDIF